VHGWVYAITSGIPIRAMTSMVLRVAGDDDALYAVRL
jgi:hypothetical protein